MRNLHLNKPRIQEYKTDVDQTDKMYGNNNHPKNIEEHFAFSTIG
jgi:hypothetical protein